MPLNITDSEEEKQPEVQPSVSEIVPAPPEKKQSVSKLVPIIFGIVVLAAVVFLLYTYDIISFKKQSPIQDQMAETRPPQGVPEASPPDTAVHKTAQPSVKDTTSQIRQKPTSPTAPSKEGKGPASLQGQAKKTEKTKPAPAKTEQARPAVAKTEQAKPAVAKKEPVTPAPQVPGQGKKMATAEPKPQKPAVKKGMEKPAGGETTHIGSGASASTAMSKKNAERTSAPPVTKGHLALYISSYHERKFAEEEVARWREAGYDAFVYDSGDWHRVAIGRYNSVEDARKLVGSLKQAFEYGYWIGPC
ncbi:MAG TPA: SPOR domain-containing protein [Bacteroidota bacterium]|nr:SPOR domain-containing protein [Bacteroidota bacterium]